MGRAFSDLMHPDDVPAVTETFLRALTEGTDDTVEARVLHADGHWVPLDVALTIIHDAETGEVEEIRAASRDATERHRLEEELRRLAVEDALTGLPNRRGLAQRLDGELRLAARYGDGALVLLDLDEFKEINDTRGHSAGDLVLERVAQVLRDNRRESDHVARLGGDEFAILLPRTDREGAEVAANAILDDLRTDEKLTALYGRPVTASAGIALLNLAGEVLSAETLLVHADQAMYVAKRAGGDRAAMSELATVLKT